MTTIGDLRARLGAGMSDGLRLDRLTAGQLDRLQTDIVDLLSEACKVELTRMTRPRGKERLRLVVLDGQPLLERRDMASLRRRKPVHVRGAAS